jgi:hypothetical protein
LKRKTETVDGEETNTTRTFSAEMGGGKGDLKQRIEGKGQEERGDYLRRGGLRERRGRGKSRHEERRRRKKRKGLRERGHKARGRVSTFQERSKKEKRKGRAIKETNPHVHTQAE